MLYVVQLDGDETQAKNITVKLDVNIESHAVAVVREEILSRQCDSSIVFLKDNRQSLEHAHHQDTVPLNLTLSPLTVSFKTDKFSKTTNWIKLKKTNSTTVNYCSKAFQ